MFSLTEKIKSFAIKITGNKKYLFFVLLIVIILITAIFLIIRSKGPSEVYVFSQNSWTGGESTINFPSHLFNRYEWNNFYDKSDNVSTERNLSLNLVTDYHTDSGYDDFNRGIKNDVAVEGIGDEGEVILGIFDVFEIGNVVSVSSGTAHTCAVSDVGYVYCWGRGNHGQLGNSNQEDSLTPVRVHTGKAAAIDSDGGYLSNIKKISVGNDHSCAVSGIGNVYCWGYGEYGQNGNNTNSNELVPVRVHEGEALSVDSDGGYLSNIRSVSAGSEHTCVASNASNIYCWGEGSSGRLGNNEKNTYFIPVRVRGGKAMASDTVDGYLSNIRDVSSGSEHTCVVSNTNNVYCWGHRERLGIETTEDELVPIRILAGEALASDKTGVYLANMRNISAGHLHTCAVSNAGNAYCWGYGQYGQLGNNSTANQRVPVLVQAHDRETPRSDQARISQVYYLANMRNISAGNLHTCAVSNANNVYCWGHGQFGQLGNNSTTNRSLPARVHVGEAVYADKDETYLSNMDIVSPGYRQTCSISRANHVYCWGHGYHGQLGNNNKRNYHTPVRPRKPDFRLYFVVAKHYFTGEFVSGEIDTGQRNVRFTNLEFLATESREIDVKFQIRTAETEDDLYNQKWYGPKDENDFYKVSNSKINPIHDGDRWIQYKIFMETINDSFTPIVSSVSIGYEFYPDSEFLISSPYDAIETPTYLKSIKWKQDAPEGTFIKFQMRVSRGNKEEPGEWTPWIGPDGTEDSFFEDSEGIKESLEGVFNERIARWFQYKAFLGSTEGIETPTLNSVEIVYMQ